MNATNRKSLMKTEAARKLEMYLKSGLAGFYQQAWDRLNAAGFDIDLRREPTVENALALLWLARNR
jgi:hypothetical protein